MARRSRILAVLLLALALAASTNAQLPDAVKNAKVADLPTSLPGGVSIAKNKYIVQLSRPAAADQRALSREGASPESLRRGAEAQQSTFSTFVQRNKLPVKIDRQYKTLFNGVAVTVKSKDDLAKLASAAGVKRIYPVLKHDPPRPKLENAGSSTVVPQYAHALTNIDKVKQLFPELDGRGIKIGVIDTGIDWKHPAFAEPGKTCETFKGPGCRVLYGHDFVGDEYDSNNDAAVPKPDNDPMDCNGHGTHCAGISGGKDERIEGVAPGAVFGAYRIFGCEGSTSTDIIIAALEQSYMDGMSVINMSLGGGRVTDDYPTAQAVDILSDNGVYTMSAVGNSGVGGISWVSAPGVASRGIGVASFDNSHILALGADVAGAGDLKTISFAYSDQGQKFTPDVPQPIIRSNNAPTVANDGCDPFPADHFKGGVALVRRGTCAFTQKGVNAANAGATGIIVYNNVPGDMSGGIVDPAQLKIPIAFVSGKNGEALYAAAATPSEVKITFKKDLVGVPSATAGLPSGFSSWGLTQNLQMKPDVGAPGGFIYSAYPIAGGSYATLSGTSMATPYMAGIAALYVQKNGESQGPESFQELQRRIHITARPSFVQDGRELAESVAKVGAGLVDGLALLTNEVDVSPSKFEFGDSPNWPRAARKSGTLTIRNNGKDTKTYRLTHTPSRAIMPEGGRATAQFGLADVYARVTFSQPSVTLKPGAEATVRVTVDPNVPLLGKLPEPGHWQYSGYITLQTEDRQNQLNVPYAVMTGDFTTFAVLPDAKSPNAPILTNGLATFPFPIPVPVYNSTVMPTFDLSDIEQTPAIKLTTLFPARRLALSVSNADTKQVVGYALVEDYAQQLTGAGVAFTGEVLPSLTATERVPVADGKYTISLHYTKPSLQLPTDLNAALFKAWDSPVFEIKRKAALPAPAP